MFAAEAVVIEDTADAAHGPVGKRTGEMQLKSKW